MTTPRWRYIRLTMLPSDDHDALLNRYGDMGWELVSVTIPPTGPSGFATAYFKGRIDS